MPDIRPLTPDDEAACVEVGVAAFRPVYDAYRAAYGDDDLFARFWPDWERPQAGAIEAQLAMGRPGWVVEEDGAVVGFTVAFVEGPDGLGDVKVVAVAPEAQGRGLGAALLARAVAAVREAGMAHCLAAAWRTPGDEPARRLLAAAGFVPAATQVVTFGRWLTGELPPVTGRGHIRPATAADADACVRFGVEAFRPVFAWMERNYGADLFDRLRPDWEQEQADYLAAACTEAGREAWVFDDGGGPAGLMVLELGDHGLGQIELLAVDPARQASGIGTALNAFGLEWLRDAGVDYAWVGTGDDPGHESARRAYLRVGFAPLPMQWDLLTLPL